MKLTLFFLLAHYISFSQIDSCAFFGNRSIFPYYHSEPKNAKDFYTLKKDFLKSITAETTFDGIITVIFFINYKGETNFYTSQICDQNYKTLPLSADIDLLCSQIVQAVKQTSPWKPALDEKRTLLIPANFILLDLTTENSLKYFLNSFFILLMVFGLNIQAQMDSFMLEYKFERCKQIVMRL